MFVRDPFALAVADKLSAKSPATALKICKVKKPIRKTPSFEDFQGIVTETRGNPCNGDVWESGNFVESIGLAGLGQAEACALIWGDIDWRKQQITTFRLKTSRGFAMPLYPQLRPLLERMRQERETEHAGTLPADEKVFRVLDAKKTISAACKRLELPVYSHRSFLRMFITRAIEKGVDVKVIAEWQGHRDGGNLILDTYSHVALKHSARMAKLINAWIAMPRPSTSSSSTTTSTSSGNQQRSKHYLDTQQLTPTPNNQTMDFSGWVLGTCAAQFGGTMTAAANLKKLRARQE